MYSRRLRLKGMPGYGRKGGGDEEGGYCYTTDVSAAAATRSPSQQRRLFIVPSHPGTLAPIKTDHRIWAFSAPSTEARQVYAGGSRVLTRARRGKYIVTNWGETRIESAPGMHVSREFADRLNHFCIEISSKSSFISSHC